MKDLSKDKPFQGVVDIITTDAYLGDAVVVEGVLRQFVDAFIQDRSTFEELAERLGRIFLGQGEKGFTVTPLDRWNQAGGIDTFIKQVKNIDESAAADVMKHYFLMMFADIVEVFSSKDMNQSETIEAAEAIIKTSVYDLLGVPLLNRIGLTYEIGSA